MELRQLQGFVTVAGCGTVTEGAHLLGLAPASVSEQIRRLEGSLGVKLFERTPAGMRLTEHGRALLPQARGLLDHAAAVRASVTGHLHAVHVGALETLIATHLPGIMKRLAARRPDITLDLRSMPRRRLLTEVARGVLDAGLLLDTGSKIGTLGFDTPLDLDFLDVGEVRLALVAAPGGLTDTLLVTETDCSFRMAADQVFGDRLPRRELSGVSTVRAWARQGLGMALLPDFAVADDLADGTLAELEADAPPLVLRLIWRSGREEHLREVLYAMSA